MEAKIYRLEKFEDILKIPKDLRAAFLAELPALFEHLDAIIELATLSGELIGAKNIVELGKIEWKDDGKPIVDTTCRVVVKGATDETQK